MLRSLQSSELPVMPRAAGRSVAGQWAGGSACSKERPALRQAAGSSVLLKGPRWPLSCRWESLGTGEKALHYQQGRAHSLSSKGDLLG